MPNPIWSGSVSFGLVSIPVRLYPATESKDVKFHLLHRADGSRIQQRYFCQEDGEAVEWDDLVRGYEVSPGRYVALTEEDFAGVAVKSTNELQVASFVPLSKVDPILFQRTYYLEPEELGVRPFALLRQVLQDKQKVAIATFTLRTKEHCCVLRAYENVLALSPLFYKDEVRPTELMRKPGGADVPTDLLDLATQYVEALSTSFEHAQYSDGYRAALVAMLNEKAAALPAVEEAAPMSPALPDLIEALRHAVDEVQAKRTRQPQSTAKVLV